MSLSVAAERENLRRHGTRTFVLPPGAILGAARQDIEVKRRKAEKIEEAARPYAFCRQHVKKAETVRDLIQAALDDIERGLGSGKLNTRLIYSDEGLLRAALALLPVQEEAAA